jgi:sugar O-acyltransferase (sialic acid O-acetyltransferase NeuD family)
LTRDLIILGAGGASREIAGAVEDINSRQKTWKLLGFLDDDPAKLGQTINGVPVLGPISSALRYSALFAIGIASARNRCIRERIVEILGLPRDRFASVIHPSASVSRYAKIGFGSFVLHNAVINPDAVVGNHVIVEYGAMIGHDAVVEDFVTIGPGAIVSGSARLSRGVFLGAGSMIREGLTINQGALIGMGAVVVKDVASRVTMVGNPAHPLSSR